MVSFNWVITLPSFLSEEKFESWYLGYHTLLAKDAHEIKRYCINRALSEQPSAAEGDFFRIAQEYWEDWDSMVECWNHTTGYALLGDGSANMGLDPGTLPAVALTDDVQLDVARPAAFSTVRRGYRSSENGTIVKFLAYGMAKQPDSIGSWYRESFAGLGQDDRVREHVFGTTLGKKVKVGYLNTLPAEHQQSYDWLLELWFDDAADANAFLGGEEFGSMWSQLDDASTDRLAGLFRGQEMLMKNMALDHRD